MRKRKAPNANKMEDRVLFFVKADAAIKITRIMTPAINIKFSQPMGCSLAILLANSSHFMALESADRTAIP